MGERRRLVCASRLARLGVVLACRCRLGRLAGPIGGRRRWRGRSLVRAVARHGIFDRGRRAGSRHAFAHPASASAPSAPPSPPSASLTTLAPPVCAHFTGRCLVGRGPLLRALAAFLAAITITIAVPIAHLPALPTPSAVPVATAVAAPLPALAAGAFRLSAVARVLATPVAAVAVVPPSAARRPRGRLRRFRRCRGLADQQPLEA